MEADYSGSGMLESCYRGLGDAEGLKRAARMTFERVQKALESNPRDAPAVANGALSLAVLGEYGKAREWAERALKLDPNNYILRSNIACAYAMELNDHERALDLVEDTLIHLGRDHVRHVSHDPDFTSLHQYPRFHKMLADAKVRHDAAETVSGS
jgi:adenylate cyclase